MNPIGIFDSGVGGLGIFKEIATRLPHHDLIYCADNKNFPFGEKTAEQLKQINARILDFLITKHDIKLAVIACNTSSTSSLAYLREHFSIPIVGVVPVVKPACQLTKTKKVAIMATPFTAHSDYQKELIAKYAGDTQVLSIPCADLVGLIEHGQFDDPLMINTLRRYVQPALDAGVDVVGLACTHYPFVRHHIQQLVGPAVTIIDSNEAVARHTAKLVEQMIPSNPSSSPASPHYTFYVTKEPEAFQRVGQMLLGNMVNNVTLITL